MEVLFWWVLFGLGFFFASGACKEGQQFWFACSSQSSVVLILPGATADKFQVPAKHLLSNTRTVLVPTQKVYLLMYSLSFCSCQGVKYNFSPWKRWKINMGLQIIVFWVKREDKVGSCFMKVVTRHLKPKEEMEWSGVKTENGKIERKMRKAF